VRLNRKEEHHKEGRKRYTKCSNEKREEINEGIQRRRIIETIEEERQEEESESNPRDREETIRNRVKKMLELAQKQIPTEKPKDRFRRHKLSERSENKIKERARARKERNLEEFERLSKQFKKNRKEDRKERVLETLDKDLDLRDRWLGIRELKAKYNPIPYHNTDKEGKHVKWKDRAQKAADHLSKTQWGKDTEEDNRKEEE
jgi:hypothetical protein